MILGGTVVFSTPENRGWENVLVFAQSGSDDYNNFTENFIQTD